MPQDPNLYGNRPAKKQKREMALSSSLDFTSQMTSLISKPNPSSSSTAIPASSAGRARPSKSKEAFPGVRIKRKDTPTTDADPDPRRLRLKSPVGTEDDKAAQARARRKMEEKARLYAAMKRGDYVPKEGEAAPLVDFDRKWAEGHPDASGLVSSSSSEDDDDYKDTETISYTDEFGRTRTGTRAEKSRVERRATRGATSARELAQMSARPRAPGEVIYGDAIQAQAFVPADEAAMEAAARKRDRSLTPPDALHYDAGAEIRTRGTGFYAFSRDEKARTDEMASLEAERARTEAVRKEREEKVEARRREVEARRKEIGERRAKKMAESFLDGLGSNFLDGGGEAEVTKQEEAPEKAKEEPRT